MYDNIEDLRNSTINCRKCKLCNTRNNIVFGVGNINTNLMFIGEGPGGEWGLYGGVFQALRQAGGTAGRDQQELRPLPAERSCGAAGGPDPGSGGGAS